MTVRSSALRPILRVVVLTAFLLVGGGAAAQTHVQLVLDASGSMFNRLEDGRYRITAAKDVLVDFVGGLVADSDLNVGLRVYGARIPALDPGACDDSELVVPMTGVDRTALLDAVRGVQAKGATPIARSLELAGADFPPGARGVIVLVTDGEESCGGNPARVMAALREAGLDVDLRIVGIDLLPLAAETFEGLGTFENARSATELAAALGRAVGGVTEASEELLEVTALVLRDGAPAADGARIAFVGALSERRFEGTLAEPGRFVLRVPAGAFRAEIDDAFRAEPLQVGGLAVAADGERLFTFELADALSVTLTVEPVDPVVGSRVSVTYSGAPGGERHRVTLVPVDAADGDVADWDVAPATDGTLSLRVPDDAATLEARSYLFLPEGGVRVIGRSEPIESRESVVRLEAPAEVGAGARFEVTWEGPNLTDDYLTIVPEGAPAGTYRSYAYTRSGNPVVLTAPFEAGSYEVRYSSDASRGRIIASVPITVTEQAYALDAPDEAAAGSAIEITWSGPGNPGEYVTIVPAGSPVGTYREYRYMRDGNPLRLSAPPIAGDYEIRYATEGVSPNPTLASRPLRVVASEITLDAPETVGAGTQFTVRWTGPDGPSDYVTIVPVGSPDGTYLSYAYTSGGPALTLAAPPEPGAYELRYASDRVRGTFARRPITVEAVSITLDAPDVVEAGASFTVRWTGPDGPSDYITIVAAGARDGAYLSYAYTSRGPEVVLTAPSEPGSYEIRYASDRVSGTFARRPITVR
jgi:Ca-activated chloride channel homolog